MKKILFLILIFQFKSSYALDITFETAKNSSPKIEYNSFFTYPIPTEWYVDFWNTVSAVKNYHRTTLLWKYTTDDAWNFQKTYIPHVDEVFIYMKNMLWEPKLKKLLQEWKISIFWEKNKCIDWEIHPSLKKQKTSCLYEDDKNLFVNTDNLLSYWIESPKKQKIKLKIFPVTNKDYIFPTYDEYDQWKFPIFTFIDSSLDYYGLLWRYSTWTSDRLFDTGVLNINFKKKYILTKFDNTYQPPKHIIKNKTTKLPTLYTLVPYYETEIEVQKWWNTILLAYGSYTYLSEELNENITIHQ